jgi:predicted permease
MVKESGIKTLKMLIVTVFLPSSLFFAFLGADLDSKYLILPAIVILLCFLLYLAGTLLKKLKLLDSIYSSEYFTGFEFGMVGIALFSGIFGAAALPVISLIGLGHEFFIWFIYLPLLKSHSAEYRTNFLEILISFIKSPIIIAILSAIIMNKAGIGPVLLDNFITGGILTAVNWFSRVTVSVVLIVLGCSLNFKHLKIAESLKYIFLRYAFVALTAIPAFFLVTRLIPNLPPLFMYAWITFFILPPPYIIPIYVPESHKKENNFLSNTIMLYTLTSLTVYIAFLFLNTPV